MKKLFITLLFLFGTGTAGFAQIVISPTNVFVDSQTRFGSYLVINGGDEAQEISIDFVFGFTAIDAEGNKTLVYDDSTRAENFSAAGWVRAFPQNFILQAGERQTVRMRVAAPNDLPDKMYWARIKTTSSPVSPPVGTASEDAITARIGVKLQQITGLYYRVGDVQTGIVIGELDTNIDQDSILWVAGNIERSGNAPFLGSIYTTVYDENNEKVAESVIATTLYFGGTLKRPVDIGGLPSGNYTAEIRFETQRGDIAAEQLVQMQPIEKLTNFTIE